MLEVIEDYPIGSRVRHTEGHPYFGVVTGHPDPMEYPNMVTVMVDYPAGMKMYFDREYLQLIETERES